jgi:DNA-binding response OmpR family regulator
MKPRILYIEDDKTLGFLTKDNLELNGYEVIHCEDGKTGWDTFQITDFDLCILDIMLPEMDGYQLAEKIRKRNIEIPILFLTAKSMKEDKIQGLKIGGDDYLTKPFSIEELVLKIEIFLKRRTIFENSLKNKFQLGNYLFDFDNLTLTLNEDTKTLTQREGELLIFMIKNKNNLVKREEILEAIWGENDYFMGRSLDVFISRLRKYLQEDPSIKIENHHGVGFRLVLNSN